MRYSILPSTVSFKKITTFDLKRSFCTDEALTGTDDQESRAAPFYAIREEIKQITPVIVDEGPVAKKSKPAPGMDFLLAGSWRNTVSENADTTKDSVNEFGTYLQTAEEDNGTNPLQWWKENAFRFPANSKVAQKYLANETSQLTYTAEVN